MKIILEIPELEAIVKENIASKYPNQDAQVTIQNKRNGVEVTVVLTDKKQSEAPAGFTNVSAEIVETGCCGTVEDKTKSYVDEEEENLA